MPMPKSKKTISNAGGAANSLIDKKLSAHADNSERDLFYDKINDKELSSLFPKNIGEFPDESDDSYIGKILHKLGSDGLIDPEYSPSYSLGSTRLAALKYYGTGSVDLDQYETDDVLTIASGKKVDYGDLDVDVVFTADKKEIVKSIESIDPSSFAASVGKDSINIAIRLGERVVQVDLVDVSTNKNSQDFLWKSSFVDLAEGVKGAFSILLLRSVASAMEIDSKDTLDSVIEYAKDNPKSDFAKDFNKKTDLGYKPTKTRFSLGDKGLKLVVDMKKDDSKSECKIDFEPSARQSYEDLDELAKVILRHSAADKSTIFSATKLAEFIKDNFSAKQTEKVWDAFVLSVEKNLKGKTKPEDVESGINAIGKILDKNHKEEKKPLKEGREAIGRFVGPNKFSNKNMMLLLRTLIRETGNEGNTTFTIDLKSSPAVDLVEKVDSTFVNFGIDPSGEFFMESSNSGAVKKQDVQERFGFNPDLLQSFKWLNRNKVIQQSLQEIYNTIGSFKYDAELFPILTHQGDENGNVVFVGTPYDKTKMGKFGGFVVFKAQIWDDEEQNWSRPEPQQNVVIVDMIKRASVENKWQSDWMIYTNERDMKHPVKLTVELDSALVEYFVNDETFTKAMEIISSKNNENERKQILFSLNRLREVLQDKLNTYAANAKSVLGGEESYLEGVILRVKDSNGDIFEVKGTSAKFDDKKEKLWVDRVNILNLEKKLETKMMLDVLELKTAHPATLNKVIRKLANEFDSNERQNSDARLEFVKKLMVVISDKKEGYNKVKTNAIGLLNEIQNDFIDIENQFEQNKQTLDADSVRKTKEFLVSLTQKIEKFRAAIQTNLDSLTFYVYMLNLVVGHRIDKFISFGDKENIEESSEIEHKKIIIWNGRAQPWHKGHHEMIRKGKSLMPTIGAEAIYIMVVKGGKTSIDKEKNPLSEQEQINLIAEIYANDSQVVVHPVAIPGSFIGTIGTVIQETGFQVVGWLAGADRINDYRRMLDRFDPSKLEGEPTYNPFQTDRTGQTNVSMIETPRVLSGTKVRKLTHVMEPEEWISYIAPENIDQNARLSYSEVYERIKNPQLSEIVFDTVYEMSAAGAGAVGGFGGPLGDFDDKRIEEELFKDEITEENQMDRQELVNEMKLRKYIRRAINIVEKKNNEKITLQENKVRMLIRKLINEVEEGGKHKSTGINVLEDLLKKIIPIYELDYKSLTTDQEQRRSYRAHTINAIRRSLAPSRADITADNQIGGIEESEDDDGLSVGGTHSASPEGEGSSLSQDVSKDPMFIDIEPEKEEPEVDPEESFGIPGEDETGKRVALKSWKQTEQNVLDAFEVLGNAEDREIFFTYLLKNVSLYFQKWESEMDNSLEDPTDQLAQDSGNEQRASSSEFSM